MIKMYMSKNKYKSSTTPHKSSGFTLVELLAVILVFVAISSMLMTILSTVLRGNNKTNSLNSVQTNGDYAISQMTKSIRNASTLLNPFPCGTVSSPTATPAVKLAFPDGSVATFSCKDSSGNATISSNSAALINTNAVKVSTCSFTCAQSSPSDYPIIGIDFSLSNKTSSSLTEQNASSSAVEFKTSVVIRNLVR